MDVQGFVNFVAQYPVITIAEHIAIFLPPAEILLGIALILQLSPKKMALASGGILIFFTVFYLWGYVRAGIEDCSCFGSIPLMDGSAIQILLRNTVLVGMSYIAWKYDNISFFSGIDSNTKNMAMLATGIVVFTLAGVSSERPLSVSTNVASADLDNPGNVNISSVVEMAEMQPEKTYMIYVYSVTCPACWDSMENIKSFKTSGAVDDIIGITAASDQAYHQFNNTFDMNFQTYLVDNSTIRSLTDRFPRALLVRNNRVIGQIPYPTPSPHRLDF